VSRKFSELQELGEKVPKKAKGPTFFGEGPTGCVPLWDDVLK